MRILFLFVVLLISFCSVAQEYRLQRYRVEDGLPGDVIKSVISDSLGFIWMATDNGLVKYDGIKFTTYPAALQSQYCKSFLITHDKKLLVIGDLDLLEIQNQIDTVVFKSLIKGSRTKTDSTISYPRSIYEDREGNIWLAEPQSLVKYANGKLKRFEMKPEDHSPVFIRSFTFFENDDGVLFSIAYNGKVFRYDPVADKFEQTPFIIPDDVSHAKFFKHQLWIAGSKGVYTATSKGKEIGSINKLFEIDLASFITIQHDSLIWVATYNEDVYRLNRVNSSWQKTKLPFSFSDANQVFVTSLGDVWLSSDKGVLLVQEKIFKLADAYSDTHFIESISEDTFNQRLYFCAKEFLFSKDLSGGPGKILVNIPTSYFQVLRNSKDGLWVSDRSKVYLRTDEKILKEFDFSKEGSFVNDINVDSDGNAWICQEANPNVIVINHKTFQIQRHKVASALQELNIIRQGENGMYLGSHGVRNYLYHKPEGRPFRNISKPPSFPVNGDFNINDLIIMNNQLWLASTQGLLFYTDSTLNRVDLGERFTTSSVSSIEQFDDSNFLFANAHGLFRYDIKTGEFWLYDENTGLPSNTITRQGIFVDHNKGVWVGTSYGLGYSGRLVIKDSKTPKPYCIEAKVNGSVKRISKNLRIPYGSFIDLQFTSITFPEKADIQYKFEGENNWHVLENGKLTLTDLKNGQYTLFIRAKNLAHRWSDQQTFEFYVSRPYWQTANFIIAVLILIAIIAWISYMVSAQIMEKRKQLLQNLVNERTLELQEVNRELMLRNTELDRFVYSASHDLSAPLKSLMGLVNVAKMEKPGAVHEQYLRMMERSILKLDQFIREVVSYSRNSRMPLKHERFNFKEFVEGLLTDFQYSPNYSFIKFIIEDYSEGEIVCDVTRLKIILNNLISNAIHFHRNYGNIAPYVKIRLQLTDGHYLITVEDNGKGISEHHIDKIFNMFYRASEDSQGSGLGLYILKESVTKLDGEVKVTSKVDEGTTFKIKVPVPLTTNVIRSTGS